MTPNVFLDANVVIQAGKPPGGPLMQHVRDLVAAGFIKVLTTDLTKTEVAKKHAINDYEVIKELGRAHFRKLVQETVGAQIPTVSKDDLIKSLSDKYAASTESMFKGLNAETLSIDNVKPSSVFNDYAAQRGFFAGEGKKDQFPDAFILECLKQKATATSPVIIVSNDGDFSAPVDACEHVTLVKAIPDLFAVLGLEVEEPEVEEFLETHLEQLEELVGEELAEWGLQASDVEDAYIEDPAVMRLEVKSLRSFASTAEGDDILAIGSMKITAHVSYTHPDWDNAAYDSEDKVLIPLDNVSGEAEVEITADFSLSLSVDDDGNPNGFEDFAFRNDSFIWVELHPYDPYR